MFWDLVVLVVLGLCGFGCFRGILSYFGFILCYIGSFACILCYFAYFWVFWVSSCGVGNSGWF